MTVRELYDYATSHSLLDKEIDEVIAISIKNKCVSEEPKASSSIPIDTHNNHDEILSKVEWSTEDVLWLFST